MMTNDYQSLLGDVVGCSIDRIVTYLVEQLPFVWRDAYMQMTPRPTSIVRVPYNTFEYIYDQYSYIQNSDSTSPDSSAEDRLVGVLGRSNPREMKRDDSRLKGWVGPTHKSFGAKWDKGHYIAHSIGGAVDRLELNVFVQRRDLNRGWSDEGRRYREMERYCKSNPGTFCFSRPVYVDQTPKPASLEFGILKSNGELWLECFDNQLLDE